MKYLIILFAIVTHYILIDGVLMNYEVIDKGNEQTDTRFIWFDLDNEIIIDNDEFQEGREGVTLIAICVIYISLFVRLMYFLFNGDSIRKIAFLGSISVSVILEVFIMFLYLNFINNETLFFILGVLFIIVAVIMITATIPLMSKDRSGYLNIYNSLYKNLYNEKEYNTKLKQLNQSYKSQL